MYNNPMQILQEFQQFKESMKGKDANAMLQELLDSGKVTPKQLDQAKKMAEQFKGILH